LVDDRSPGWSITICGLSGSATACWRLFTPGITLAGDDGPGYVQRFSGIFLLSIASLRNTDLRPQIPQIKVAAMGMYGNRDLIVHPKQWKPMQEGIPHARIERFPRAGHFIMLDEPQLFMNTLRDFLDCEAATP
jgi:pimeloyl-ACP methyl ester carboxylesterase